MTQLHDSLKSKNLFRWLNAYDCLPMVCRVDDNLIWTHTELSYEIVKRRLDASWDPSVPQPVVDWPRDIDDWPRDEDSQTKKAETVKDKAPTTRVVREIFSPNTEGREYYHVVSPQEEGVDVDYCEQEKTISSISIPLDVAEAVAHAILACAAEMREQEKRETT